MYKFVHTLFNNFKMATYKIQDHKRGTTFRGLQFQLKINGTAKDLTGAKVKMSVGSNIFSTETGEIIFSDITEGKFQIKSQVINIKAFNYKYSMIFIFANGDIKEYLTGTWKILA